MEIREKNKKKKSENKLQINKCKINKHFMALSHSHWNIRYTGWIMNALSFKYECINESVMLRIDWTYMNVAPNGHASKITLCVHPLDFCCKKKNFFDEMFCNHHVLKLESSKYLRMLPCACSLFFSFLLFFLSLLVCIFISNFRISCACYFYIAERRSTGKLHTFFIRSFFRFNIQCTYSSWISASLSHTLSLILFFFFVVVRIMISCVVRVVIFFFFLPFFLSSSSHSLYK